MHWAEIQELRLSQRYLPQKSTTMKLSQHSATPTQQNESRPTPSSTKIPTPVLSANSKKNSPTCAPNSVACPKTTISTHPYPSTNKSLQSADQMVPWLKYPRQKSQNNYR